MTKPDHSPEAAVERLFRELGLPDEPPARLTQRKSRFSSNAPEDIAWRVNAAWVDAAIEGMKRDPDLAAYVDGMTAAGLSIEHQIERLTAVNLEDIRGLCTDPRRSPEAIARRRKATDAARAANMRQGYVFDAVLEQATQAYVLGEISREEYRARLIRDSGSGRQTNP